MSNLKELQEAYEQGTPLGATIEIIVSVEH
jgi:hypothetical protein